MSYNKYLIMKVFKFIGFTLLVIGIAIAGILFQVFKMHFASTLTYKQGEIKILRKQHNIPQVHAYSLESAFYAWGYTTAEDRLFQIAFRRAAVKGQLSQNLGSKTVELDKMFRELNFHGWAQRASKKFQKQNATQYQIWKAYAQGVNDYYNSITFNRIQFLLTGIKWYPWTVADSIAIYKLVKWSLSFGITDQYMRSAMLGGSYSLPQIQKMMPFEQKHWLNQDILPHTTIVKDDQLPHNLPQNKLYTDKSKFKPVPVKKLIPVQKLQQVPTNQKASNSCVISGKYTQSGHTLICNDPHLQTSLPGQWYQLKIFYPDPKGHKQLYLIGASMVGVPILVGKTTYVSIVLTMNYNDIQDLYKQQINQTNYLLDGQWKPLIVRKQIINVKGQTPIQYNVYQTHRGPIIKHINFKGYLYIIPDDTHLSIRWTGFTDEEYVSFSQLTYLAEVRTHQELVNALSESFDTFPPINLLYSTPDDHYGYFALGKFPLRSHPHMGMFVQDGSKSANDWLGYVTGKDRLHLIDPERGYILTGNNKAAPSRYYNGLFDISIFTTRASRIQKLINKQIQSGRKMNKLFMRDLQQDTIDQFCLAIVKDINQKINNKNNLYQFYQPLSDFDCNFSPNSTISSVYLTFMQNIYQELSPSIENQTFNLGISHQLQQYINHFILKSSHTQQQLKKLQNSMTDALSELKNHFKSSNIKDYIYGSLHKDLMIHRPFSKVEFLRPYVQHVSPGFGNLNTINVGLMSRFHSKDYATNHRAGLRLIMSYYQDSDWGIDGGSSERFHSPYYKDQTSTFLSGGYFLMDPANRTSHAY